MTTRTTDDKAYTIYIYVRLNQVDLDKRLYFYGFEVELDGICRLIFYVESCECVLIVWGWRSIPLNSIKGKNNLLMIYFLRYNKRKTQKADEGYMRENEEWRMKDGCWILNTDEWFNLIIFWLDLIWVWRYIHADGFNMTIYTYMYAENEWRRKEEGNTHMCSNEMVKIVIKKKTKIFN